MAKYHFSRQHHNDVVQVLDTLRHDVGACCVFLTNVMGNTVLSSGEQETLPMDEINALLGGSISALEEAGKTLGDQQHNFNLVYQREGSRHYLFAINVGEKLLLTLLIPKTQFGTPMGAVMHYSQRVAKTLGEMLQDQDEEFSPQLSGELPDDLDAAITEDLDALFAQVEATPNDALLETKEANHLPFLDGDTTSPPLLSYDDAVQQGIFPKQPHHTVKGETQHGGESRNNGRGAS